MRGLNWMGKRARETSKMARRAAETCQSDSQYWAHMSATDCMASKQIIQDREAVAHLALATPE
jgi:hypothetical protein